LNVFLFETKISPGGATESAVANS